MKKFLLGSVAVLALHVGAGSAMAADLARPVYKAPPAPVAVYNWTGFYLGVNVGYGVGRDSTDMSTVSASGFPIIGAGTPLYGSAKSFTLSPNGVVGGGQIGYNWQAGTNWVYGLEADIQGSGMKDTQNCLMACGAGIATIPAFSLFPVVFSDISAEHRLDWFGTVRGRLGYSVGPVLAYVTGGFAYGNVETRGSVTGVTTFALTGDTVNAFTGSYKNSSTRTGWTVGGGVEGQLAGNWSVKAEYLYIDLGDVTDSFTTHYTQGGVGAVVGDPAATRTDTASIREHIFRLGLNYKFGGPIVARY